MIEQSNRQTDRTNNELVGVSFELQQAGKVQNLGGLIGGSVALGGVSDHGVSWTDQYCSDISVVVYICRFYAT